MGATVIYAENLGKRYRIGSAASAERTLREVIRDAALAPVRRLRRFFDGETAGDGAGPASVWALRGISLEIREGEVVGIIGRNGAGKTTLLKILSRITAPTEGRVRLSGRVGSLLEVGTGFHSELTGAENIFLCGAILGMSRAEIRRKFDEIVAFSGVEKFLHTPVKHFSSGMYMRLAFSVAAHLEPEILLVDEVLAVGDEAFQRKCLGKMGEVARAGRTVLFVSHNMAAVRSLCGRAILIGAGRIEADGDCEMVLERYLSGLELNAGEVVFEPESRRARICRVSLRDKLGKATGRFCMEEAVRVEIDYEIREPIRNAHVASYVRDRYGTWVIATTDADRDRGVLTDRKPGLYRTTWTIPAGILNSGTYHLTVAIGIHNVELFDWKDSLAFSLEPTSLTRVIDIRASIHPLLQVEIPWATERL
jgi:lipopolysaccharide transport system ATP-binding protein